jgi:parallel beta-helix repeat protein
MRLRAKTSWFAMSWLLTAGIAQHAPLTWAQAVIADASPVVKAQIVVYPDDASTGVPTNLPLARATNVVLDVAGATVSGLDFQGTVTITAPNVTLRNCRISAKGWAALDIRSDGVTVENCDIDGQAAPGIRGISISGNNVSIRHCNIHHTEDGIYLTGSSNITIENNYIHDLQSQWDGPHFDGIATDGGITDVVIKGNTIVNPHGQTSAIMLSNYFGPVTRVRVEKNRLLGGGYTVYSDGQFGAGSISNVSFLDNRMGKGHYGYASINNNIPDWSGNIDDTLETMLNQ